LLSEPDPQTPLRLDDLGRENPDGVEPALPRRSPPGEVVRFTFIGEQSDIIVLPTVEAGLLAGLLRDAHAAGTAARPDDGEEGGETGAGDIHTERLARESVSSTSTAASAIHSRP
jgi:hypothetical protein